MAKRIAILGSTGSIGTNALEVVEHLGDEIEVVALSAKTQTDALLAQVKRYKPKAVALCGDGDDRDAFESVGVRVYAGDDGLVRMIRDEPIDLVLNAIVGAAGLPASLAAVESGVTLALANKESLVVAGSLLIAEARRRDVEILPVDSEHSAVFQAMRAGRRDEVDRVILTASGGPFRDMPLEQMRNATPVEALDHPTWQMGDKITIDSATLFNKGLEVIEACWLFDLPPEKVEVVIHPESIVHSMVEFADGSTIAQLSPPDMKLPIQYALTYPHRRAGCGPRMDWTKLQRMNFEPPDLQRFGALRMAYDVARRRGTFGAVLNAANEVAVRAFLDERIAFGDIGRCVERTLEAHEPVDEPNLDELLQADAWARRYAQQTMESTKREARV